MYYPIHIKINDFSKHLIIDQHVAIFVTNMVKPIFYVCNYQQSDAVTKIIANLNLNFPFM